MLVLAMCCASHVTTSELITKDRAHVNKTNGLIFQQTRLEVNVYTYSFSKQIMPSLSRVTISHRFSTIMTLG